MIADEATEMIADEEKERSSRSEDMQKGRCQGRSTVLFAWESTEIQECFSGERFQRTFPGEIFYRKIYFSTNRSASMYMRGVTSFFRPVNT